MAPSTSPSGSTARIGVPSHVCGEGTVPTFDVVVASSEEASASLVGVQLPASGPTREEHEALVAAVRRLAAALMWSRGTAVEPVMTTRDDFGERTFERIVKQTFDIAPPAGEQDAGDGAISVLPRNTLCPPVSGEVQWSTLKPILAGRPRPDAGDDETSVLPQARQQPAKNPRSSPRLQDNACCDAATGPRPSFNKETENAEFPQLHYTSTRLPPCLL